MISHDVAEFVLANSENAAFEAAASAANVPVEVKEAHERSAATPVVNLNGTDAEVLIEGRMDAVAAIEKAIKALAEVAPHGRDYQTALPGSYAVARATFITRTRLLERVRDEIQNEAIEIDRQRRK